MRWTLFLAPSFLIAERGDSVALKGIVLLSEEKDLIQNAEALGDIKGLLVLGLDLPGRVSDFHRDVFASEQGKELDVSTIEEIEQKISRYYLEQNKPFITVSVPSQPIDQGVLQLVIQDSQLSHVSMQGNKWTSTDRIKKNLGLNLDQPIDNKKIIKGLNFLNRNPFRRMDVVFEPGRRKNTTDITVLTEERRPYRFYAGVDNTGVRFTHLSRMFAGFNAGNVFTQDDVLTGQYTASYHVSTFQAGTLQYTAPLPWQHLITVYGGYASVHADIPYPSRTNHGQSYQGSFRYILPFGESERLEQEFRFGFDFKATNNTVLFTELFPVYGNLVNLTQIVLGYELNLYRSTVNTNISANLYCSPADMLPHQTNAEFSNLRPGAKNQWVYVNASVSQVYQLPKSFSVFLGLQGQLSSQTLLPSEQLGIGGHNTVRGYDEREYNVDNGLIFNFETRSPAVSLITKIRDKKMKDAFQFLWFFDLGYGKDYTIIPGVPSRDYLMSTGPGFRYTLDPYLTARLDWGIRLHNQAVFPGSWNLLHFSLISSY